MLLERITDETTNEYKQVQYWWGQGVPLIPLAGRKPLIKHSTDWVLNYDDLLPIKHLWHLIDGFGVKTGWRVGDKYLYCVDYDGSTNPAYEFDGVVEKRVTETGIRKAHYYGLTDKLLTNRLKIDKEQIDGRGHNGYARIYPEQDYTDMPLLRDIPPDIQERLYRPINPSRDYDIEPSPSDTATTKLQVLNTLFPDSRGSDRQQEVWEVACALQTWGLTKQEAVWVINESDWRKSAYQYDYLPKWEPNSREIVRTVGHAYEQDEPRLEAVERSSLWLESFVDFNVDDQWDWETKGLTLRSHYELCMANPGQLKTTFCAYQVAQTDRPLAVIGLETPQSLWEWFWDQYDKPKLTQRFPTDELYDRYKNPLDHIRMILDNWERVTGECLPVLLIEDQEAWTNNHIQHFKAGPQQQVELDKLWRAVNTLTLHYRTPIIVQSKVNSQTPDVVKGFRKVQEIARHRRYTYLKYNQKENARVGSFKNEGSAIGTTYEARFMTKQVSMEPGMPDRHIITGMIPMTTTREAAWLDTLTGFFTLTEIAERWRSTDFTNTYGTSHSAIARQVRELQEFASRHGRELVREAGTEHKFYIRSLGVG